MTTGRIAKLQGPLAITSEIQTKQPRRSRSVSRPYSIPSAHRLVQLVSLCRFYASVYSNKFPSLVASIFSLQRLATSISSFLNAAINLRPLSVNVSTHTSASNAASLSNPPLCQTPGCRFLHNQSTPSPSHPVLSALHPQGFRTRFALETARRFFK